MDFIPCKAEQSLWGCYKELQEEAQRYLGTQEICLEATYSEKMSANSRLKAI